MPRKQFTLRLDKSNFEKIRVVAEANKRSIAAQIEYLVSQCIMEYELEYGTIEPDDK